MRPLDQHHVAQIKSLHDYTEKLVCTGYIAIYQLGIMKTTPTSVWSRRPSSHDRRHEAIVVAAAADDNQDEVILLTRSPHWSCFLCVRRSFILLAW
jgi:hypothetical protein